METWDTRGPETRWGYKWWVWWLVLVVIATAAAIDFARWPGGGWMNASRFPGENSRPVVSGDRLLDANDKLRFVGRTVHFNQVRVQDKTGSRVVLVGPNLVEELLVLLPRGISGIAPGDTVSLTGVVYQAPESVSANGVWDLRDRDLSVLDATSVYVQATAVQRQSHSTP